MAPSSARLLQLLTFAPDPPGLLPLITVFRVDSGNLEGLVCPTATEGVVEVAELAALVLLAPLGREFNVLLLP